MKRPYKRELTNEELAKLPDDDIDTSEIPELDDNFWRDAQLSVPDRTKAVTIRVRESVLDAFKAGGKGYQTRINAVLESYAAAVLKRR